ncbi:hypothetical protein Trydic_g8181 [Trypoxylus dichotomus]
MSYQNPVTGLFPASHENSHAWIRDNVYSILGVWGLAMSYKKMADQDEDRAKTYELEQSCVKLMRGLLMAMMQQKEKVEKFKLTQNPLDSLHAKYCSSTGQTVVGDNEWGHLQIDAVSLYLLILSQMTASGLQVVFNLDEVAFIQNLVFYIECAYCTPDYGIWERGDKTNHGLPELNASSIGMAKAALEAMNELDLFGARGGPYSVIHILADEAQKCQAVLQSMLPRESNSKETDSGILSVIGFPAFAVDDPLLIQYTRETITSKLQGRYGCKRFLRDGYKTAKEDANRLYYEPWELRMFENIECEWPLFFCYLILDYFFQGNKDAAAEYTEALEEIMIRTEEGTKLIPELYAVPSEFVAAEYREPGTQRKLLQEGFLAVGELDPLNRRLCSEKKPDVVVQVVIVAEDNDIRDKLADHDIIVQTIADVAPIEVQPARVLSHLYTYLGRNKKLGLSGRKSRDVGILSTSKLYTMGDRIFAFTPQFTDMSRNYIAIDYELMIDICKSEINFLKSSWQNMLGRPLVVLAIRSVHLGTYFAFFDYRAPCVCLLPPNSLLILNPINMPDRTDNNPTCKNFDADEYYTSLDSGLLTDALISMLAFLTINWRNVLGRPTVTLVVTHRSLDNGKIPLAMITTMKKLKSGYINGTRVTLGCLNDFLSTSCVTNLSFLGCHEEGLPDKLNPQVQHYLEEHLNKSLANRSILLMTYGANRRAERNLKRRMSVKGAVKKTRSINVDSETLGMEGGGGNERKYSIFPGAWGMDQVDHHHHHHGRQTRSPSPEVPHKAPPDHNNTSSGGNRHRTNIEYADTEVEELFAMLRESDSLEEQGDILQYLVDSKGPDFNTGMLEYGKVVTVRDLLKGLYEKACQQKLWGLVRHTAGMLGKRVEDLAKAVTDLLVRQKQITVGMPPHNEHTITAPLPETDLRMLIHEAYGEDDSTAMLTQELLVYLAMFIRTEPQLFLEMLRLRVGLIIQVMATELSRTLICDAEEASEHLLNLSPFEMKNLLYHIISGKEFAISSVGRGNFSIVSNKSSKISKKSHISLEANADDQIEPDRQGQWLRRRRLDGALNRVPRDFYPRVWSILEKCQGLDIAGKMLPQSLTQEMTSGELKFALAVETVLNSIPQPEYRQLIVEALMVLTLVAEYNVAASLGGVIQVEQLVHAANELFLNDQIKCDGDATLCCAKPKELWESSRTGGLLCGGAAFICQHFYDSAPSGCYGTMTYMTRAVVVTLDCIPKQGELDCTIS